MSPTQKPPAIWVMSQKWELNTLRRAKQTGANGLPVNNEGLFTDAEAGKDPSQQIIGAERTGDFPKQLLRLA